MYDTAPEPVGAGSAREAFKSFAGRARSHKESEP